MTTQELKCFLCVAERLNFSRAAEELYLTPPTVTHHIQKLEKELGAQLFYRDSKSVRLTAEGETFYLDAQEIIMKIEDAFSHLNNLQEQKQQLLRIGCTTAAETIFLSEPLTLFREKFPDADPRILLSDFSSLQRMMAEKHLDLVMGTRDMVPVQGDYHFTPLFPCKSCAVFCKNYEFRPQSEEVSLEELRPFPLLVLRLKSFPLRRDDCIEKFLNEKQTSQRIIRQEDPSAVITLAKSGYGIGILPQYAISKQAQNELNCIRIKESPSIEYGLIQRIGRVTDCMKNFVSILQKQT